MVLQLLAWFVAANLVAFENDYVVVTKNAAPFASAHAGYAERIVVALGDLEVASGPVRQKLARGDIAVFAADQTYEPPQSGTFFEVAIKANHPPVLSPAEMIAPEKNTMRYDGERFFVFEEKLAPGETRARHSHSQRVVMQLNRTQLQQWPDNGNPILVETVPEKVSFNPPVIHVVRNVGDTPLRGIIIEFKPQSSAKR